MGDDVELFSMPEMAAAFDLDRVSANPARFDLKKCQAINAEHVRRLDPDDLTERILPFLQGAGVLPGEPTDEQRALLRAAVPLVQTRMTLLTEAVGMLRFLFVDDVALELEEASVAALPDDAATTLSVAYDALVQFEHWTAADIEGALRVSLVDGLGLKPKTAFTPVRVAVTGRRVSPPLFESMELLGRESSLSRLRSALSTLSG
jgi:glutamyl-tRNA synthetase